jgi:methionyl aminopeptidase
MKIMEKEALENYKKAFSVSQEVIKFAKKLLNEERKVLNLAEKIEEKMAELGAKPAFPVNICINEIAAHYTPDLNDTSLIQEGDLVKVDIGIHLNGYICDRAFTVCMGEKKHPLIETAEHALNEALKLIKPGIKVFEISNKIEDIIVEKGFNPVRNLSGHGLERFDLHAKPSIPNGKNTINEELKEGQVIAMEIFVTNGRGLVKDSSPILIYQYKQDKPVRLWEARKILFLSKEKFKGLPFAKRWLKDIPLTKRELAIKQLVDTGALVEHPILKEISNGLVAQAEETVIVK